jgi:hypothetical protein
VHAKFLRRVNLRYDSFWPNFVRPAAADFFWRFKQARSMVQPRFLRLLIGKDYAIGGPVRTVGSRFLSICGYLGLAAIATILMAGSVVAAQPAKSPSAGDIKKAVEKFFASQAGFQPGDLISSSQIAAVLAKFDRAGIAVPHADKIAARGLPDDSFMVRQLSCTSGRKFMRKLAGTPGSYSRVDRLSAIPGGEKLLSDLARDKDGDKLIEYLATTKGGQNMGKMMAAVPGGENLNRPTDRIYTVQDLVEAINAEFAAASP